MYAGCAPCGPCWLTQLSGRGEAEACVRTAAANGALWRAGGRPLCVRTAGLAVGEACVLPLAAAADAATIRTGSVSLVARPQFSQCGRTAVPLCGRAPCCVAVPLCGAAVRPPPCRRTDVQSGADVPCRRAAVRHAVLPCRRAVRAAVRCRHSVVRRAAVPPCKRAVRPCGREAVRPCGSAAVLLCCCAAVRARFAAMRVAQLKLKLGIHCNGCACARPA